MLSYNQNLFLLLTLLAIIVLTLVYFYFKYSQYKNKEEMCALKNKVQKKDFNENEENV